MTDAAEAVQQAALQQGCQPRVQPSGVCACLQTSLQTSSRLPPVATRLTAAALAELDVGHTSMTGAAQAVQEAAVQQGFQLRVQPSGDPVLCVF